MLSASQSPSPVGASATSRSSSPTDFVRLKTTDGGVCDGRTRVPTPIHYMPTCPAQPPLARADSGVTVNTAGNNGHAGAAAWRGIHGKNQGKDGYPSSGRG